MGQRMKSQSDNITIKNMKQYNQPMFKKLFWLFLIEGMLYQVVIAVNVLGNTIYATNLGATDIQIGLIQTIPNAIGILLMLPVGMFAAKCKSAKTLPIILLLVMGISYLGYASVPEFGKHVMLFYLLFLGINLGVMGTYNAQWQLFFGYTVDEGSRNLIYSRRNQAMYLAGAVIPFLCGLLMNGVQDTSVKIIILRCFFYLCSAALFLQAVIIWKIPQSNETTLNFEGKTSDDKKNTVIKLSALRDSFIRILRDKKLFHFFAVMFLFYAVWQLDWSMWYIGQVKYIGLTEAQLSYYNALVSLLQMVSIGFYAKNIEKKGIIPTFLVTMVALIGYPFIMLTALLLPAGTVRIWSFIIAAVLLSIPLGCINLCVVQLLLKALPQQGKEIMMSLYSLMILISNCLVPLMGVRLYQFLGSNQRALVTFLLLELLLRSVAYIILKFHWKKENYS